MSIFSQNSGLHTNYHNDKIILKGCVSMEENNERETLFSEMYSDLKKATKFKERIIYILLVVISVLVVALACTNLYHIYL